MDITKVSACTDCEEGQERQHSPCKVPPLLSVPVAAVAKEVIPSDSEEEHHNEQQDHEGDHGIEESEPQSREQDSETLDNGQEAKDPHRTENCEVQREDIAELEIDSKGPSTPHKNWFVPFSSKSRSQPFPCVYSGTMLTHSILSVWAD